jgi:hypothetical protein
MKKSFLWAPCLALLFAASCSNDFEIAAPWQEIPVVYGILSPNDSAHYLRIEKAFLDPSASAFTVAKIADSLYYAENSISVFLDRVSNGQSYQLRRVNGTLEGYPRQDGTFATEPNWLYKIKDSEFGPGGLADGETYRLRIQRNDGRPPITAETRLPKNLYIVRPDTFTAGTPISLAGNPTTISWRCEEQAALFNVTLDIRYRELDENGNLVASKKISWLAATNVRREDTPLGGTGLYRAETKIAPSAFYKVLVDSIAPSNTLRRFFNGIDIRFEGGGAEIVQFIDVQAVNAGLTGAEVVNTYTNLSEGLGVFSSKKSWAYFGFRPTPVTLDSMNNNLSTRALNFKG